MEKKTNLTALRLLLWGAVLIALIGAALALVRPAQPTAYADAVYVWKEAGRDVQRAFGKI